MLRAAIYPGTIFGLAAVFMATATGAAQNCSATAVYVGSKAAEGTKYLFSFDVSSAACTASSCSGVLHVTASYHLVTSGNGTAAILVPFIIPAGQTHARVTVQHGPTGDQNPQVANIDGVAIDSVNCKLQ